MTMLWREAAAGAWHSPHAPRRNPHRPGPARPGPARACIGTANVDTLRA